jgi:predicted AAA+ superfamily ATPase
VALANRFGRRVRFDVRGEDWYLAIVTRLVGERLGHVPDGCVDEALRYSRIGAGPTPRTARQFAASYRP